MRIVVADDSALLREGLAGLLERQGHEIAGQAASWLRRNFAQPATKTIPTLTASPWRHRKCSRRSTAWPSV